jgi:dTDP-4-dehydrorhamnose reductase
MNILVTGADGQLGKEMRRVVDYMGNGHPDHDSSEMDYYIFAGHKELDITDGNAVKEFVHNNFINVIVNCAAYTNVEKAQSDRVKAYDINALGALNLALAAKDNGAVLIHISTDYVFSDKSAQNTPLPPVSFAHGENMCLPVEMDRCYYGYSKMIGEDLIERSGCRYLIFRTSWLYSSNKGNFVDKMFRKCEASSPSMVVCDQVGSPTNAGDLARFIYRIIAENNSENRYLSKQGIYNFCNAGVASWYDLAYAVYDISDSKGWLVTPCDSDRFDSAVFRPHYSVLDFSETSKNFNEVQVNWIESLKRVIREIEKNRAEEREMLEAENTEWSYGHNVKDPKECETVL